MRYSSNFSDMEHKPTISVIMAVYNGEKYLRPAIESILGQTFSDFEFIIINDGSTDRTLEIIDSYHDERIVYLENERNMGLSATFNKGISVARGEYIACMDADDLSLKRRFAIQLAYLKNHTDVDILGTSIIMIDEEGRKRRTHHRPKSHLGLKWASLFSTPLYHPTVIAKAEILKHHPYNEDLHNSEDYELWSRLLFTTSTRFASLSEPLLLYRSYPHSFTQSINVNKRVGSAHNTIANIEHYTPLSDQDKQLLINLRQERPLGIRELSRIWIIYMKAAWRFSRTEPVTTTELVAMYIKLLAKAAFLMKHLMKHP